MHNSQVYIITAGPFIKVGMTKDIDQRLIDLQVGCPFQQELVWMSGRRTRFNAHAIELLVHARISMNHVRGEWFDTNPHWAIGLAKKIEKDYMNKADPNDPNIVTLGTST
jgi:hypothetical protein